MFFFINFFYVDFFNIYVVFNIQFFKCMFWYKMIFDSKNFFIKIYLRIQKVFGVVYESFDWEEGRIRELCGV